MRVTRRSAAVALMVLCSAQGTLASADPLIEGARQCTQYFPVEEKKNNIPTHLLAAIATTESGRYHKGLGMSVPWPWTINVEGKGYYFDSKAEAIAQTQNLLAKGFRSIDVGCMQVNLKHHPTAFANLENAFDPGTNVAYAAKFLSTNYATLGDWIKATAAYHSRTAVHGQRYLVDIERSWNRIVGKVNEARATKAGDAQHAQVKAGTAVAASTTVARAEATPRVIGSVRPMQESRHARVIQVGSAPRSRNEVLVVKAETPAPAAVAVVADASSVVPATMAAPQVMPQGSTVRRVTLDNGAASGVRVSTSKDPQFVFAN
ncbi:MAG: lytic transglycosylase domain-containing protein [Rickettsiales bacterium]